LDRADLCNRKPVSKQSENGCGKLTGQKRAASGSKDTGVAGTQGQAPLPAGEVSMQSPSSFSPSTPH